MTDDVCQVFYVASRETAMIQVDRDVYFLQRWERYVQVLQISAKQLREHDKVAQEDE